VREIQRKDLKELITKGLSRAERLIIILYYFEEMTMKEIGATLDLSEPRQPDAQQHPRPAEGPDGRPPQGIPAGDSGVASGTAVAGCDSETYFPFSPSIPRRSPPDSSFKSRGDVAKCSQMQPLWRPRLQDDKLTIKLCDVFSP
jgi:hypothetical protein